MGDISDSENMAHIGFQKIGKKEKTGWVCHQFAEVAARYDAVNTLLSFGIHFLWKARSVRMLDLTEGEKVLDLCGGTGDLAVSALKRTGEKGQVFLYDISRDMMSAGRAKRPQGKYRKKILYVQGDAEEISFPDNSFDAVIVGFGMRNLTRMEKGFAEIYRILRPGGRMVCLEFSEPRNRLFRKIYDLYSFYLMPFLGKLLTGSAQAYHYLPESIRLFPPPAELQKKLENTGFRNVIFQSMTNGVAVAHRGRKNGE